MSWLVFYPQTINFGSTLAHIKYLSQVYIILLYHTYITTNWSHWSTAIVEKYHTATGPCTVFKMLFNIFHLYKKVSKQKGAMLDGTKTPKRRQNKMAKPPRVHGRGLDTFCQEELATAARDIECTTLGPRKLLSICIIIGVDLLLN